MIVKPSDSNTLKELKRIQSTVVKNLQSEPILQLAWKDCVRQLFMYWWQYFREPERFTGMFDKDPLTNQSQFLTRLTNGTFTLMKAYPQEPPIRESLTPEEFMNVARTVHHSILRAIDATEVLRVISTKLKRRDTSGIELYSPNHVAFRSDPETRVSEALTKLYLEIEDREAYLVLENLKQDEEFISPHVIHEVLSLCLHDGMLDPSKIPESVVTDAMKRAELQERAMPIRFVIPAGTNFSGSYTYSDFSLVHRALMALVYLLDLAPSTYGTWIMRQGKIAQVLGHWAGVSASTALEIVTDLRHSFDLKRTVPSPILPWDDETVLVYPLYLTMIGKDALFLDIGKCKYLPRFERYYEKVTSATRSHLASVIRDLAPGSHVFEQVKLSEHSL